MRAQGCSKSVGNDASEGDCTAPGGAGNVKETTGAAPTSARGGLRSWHLAGAHTQPGLLTSGMKRGGGGDHLGSTRRRCCTAVGCSTGHAGRGSHSLHLRLRLPCKLFTRRLRCAPPVSTRVSLTAAPQNGRQMGLDCYLLSATTTPPMPPKGISRTHSRDSIRTRRLYPPTLTLRSASTKTLGCFPWPRRYSTTARLCST